MVDSLKKNRIQLHSTKELSKTSNFHYWKRKFSFYLQNYWWFSPILKNINVMLLKLIINGEDYHFFNQHKKMNNLNIFYFNLKWIDRFASIFIFDNKSEIKFALNEAIKYSVRNRNRKFQNGIKCTSSAES